MLGAALISHHNEIVHVFGNLEFRKTIEKKAGENVPSTSGISSNSTFSSTHSLVEGELQDNVPSSSKEKANFNKKTEIDSELFSEVLMETILPLIVLHRTQQEARSPEMENIESDQLKFQIVDFYSNYIVVFITTERAELEAITEMFTSSVMRSLNFHYGPYIHLLETGSSQMNKIKSRVNRRMEKLIQNFDKCALPNEMFNVNLSFSNNANIQSLAGLFKEIALRISQSMLNKKCRCIFVNSGQIIGSSCSSQQESMSLFDVMDTTQLSAKKCLKCQVEQGWIHSSILRRRQLLNVFVFSLTGEIELICLSNAEYSLQTTAICDLLESLEKIGKCVGDKQKSNPELIALVQEVDRLMLTFLSQIFSERKSYLRTFGTAINFKPLFSRFSISRFGSSLSLFSNSSLPNGNEQLTCNSNSTWPSSSLSRQSRTSIAHLDAMRTQFRHLEHWQPLRPTHLGLDMLAYRFEISDIPFNYSYIPDKYRLIFSKFGQPLLGVIDDCTHTRESTSNTGSKSSGRRCY
uniref:Vacuolar fusion protein MON1 homolog n=1 Tax=Ditylenchus dipsaci TaxID=166011 RepID=A0A915D970_9BILA